MEHILREYRELQQAHQTTQILPGMFVANHNWQEILRALHRAFPGLRGSYDMNLKVSDLLEPECFSTLKQAGAAVLVGTECFSSHYLAKLNKGQTVIENIQVLKYAQRTGVPCYHNLLYGFPFEEEIDYEQSEDTISYLYHLPPPFDVEKFRLTYDSPIFRRPAQYHISRIRFRAEMEGDWLPGELHDRFVPLFYEFDSDLPGIGEREEKWLGLADRWRQAYYAYAQAGRPKRQSLLHMRYNGAILQLYDTRYGAFQQLYTLEGDERGIYEYCDTIKHREEIAGRYPHLAPGRLQAVLDRLTRQKLMFEESRRYLSLAI